MIKDSGQRTEFASGAVRDCEEGKGRCDLLPLDVVACSLDDEVIEDINRYVDTKDINFLYDTLEIFLDKAECSFEGRAHMFLEVAKHFEEGAKKYGERNWEKGIPEERYLDSAVRHYLKWLDGQDDERHDRAFVWNIICLIWTHVHIKNTL